jgi:hypothetical protein
MPEQDDRMEGLDPRVGVAEVIDADPVMAEEHRAAVAEEYGQYVATAAITHDGVRAYNVGDPVPAANVERWRYAEAGLVARVSTKAAVQAQTPAVPPGEPTVEPRKTRKPRKTAAPSTPA